MKHIAKFLIRIILNAAALWFAERYISGFVLTGGIQSLAIGALVLALLHTFVRPILRFITTPLRWITLGLFNFVINIALLYLAEYFVPQLVIQGFLALFLTSLVVSFANAFF